MTSLRRAWPLALLALIFHPACTDDTADDDTSNDNGNDDNTSNPTADGTAEGSGNDDSSVELGCAAGAIGETTDGAMEPLMETWGAACQTDQDCIDLIGDPEAFCDVEAVVYELPGGYCTKLCTLPDMQTQSVLDAPDCAAEGGVACIGVKGTHERCGIVCTDDQQCNRDGYICRQLPLIALPEDPRMCLMPDCCLDGCAE